MKKNPILTFVFLLFIIGSYSQSLTSYVPVGTVVAITNTSVPDGWLICDGSEVSQDGLTADLYAVIGSSFNHLPAPAVGNFHLPDMRGRFARGANIGQANPDAPASVIGQFQDDLIADHAHASGTLGAVTVSSGSHQHIHNHENVTATTSANMTHLHTLALGASSTPDVRHTHNANTNSVTHTHNYLQAIGANRSDMYVAGSTNTLVWSGTKSVDMISNVAEGGHNHTIGNNNVTHTHTIGGSTQNNTTATSHRHTFTLPEITSSAGGIHTHNLSGSTANSTNGSGTTNDTRPDNISMNFIIKY